MPDMKTLTINGITYNINDNNLNNLLDGSATGSLHSINSDESSSYTMGQYAMALGGNVKAGGNFSTALNFGTTAAGNSQTVIGKYNTIDTNNASAFIIGNGTADDARSNALTVDWNGNLFTGSKTAWNAGTGCYIGADGTISLQRSTSDSNAYNSANPCITFLNSNASQNIQLVFTDYDSVQAPASLTMIGNQGGEYFIAPNIKATSWMYTGSIKVDTVLQMPYNGSNYNILHNYNNGNVVLNSCSGALYLAYKNTTEVNFFDGKLFVNTAGNILGSGRKVAIRPSSDTWLRINDTGDYTSGVYFGSKEVRNDGKISSGYLTNANGYSYIDMGMVFAGERTGEAQIMASVINSSGDIKNRAYLYANADGRVGIYSVRADGTGASILNRANNSNVITFGNGNSNVLTYGYNYGAAPPIVSNTGSTTRVSHMAGHASYLSVMVYPDTASWTNKTINFSSSDIRLKENIAEPDLDALPILNQIKMHSFDWNDAHKYKHQPLGMVADELEEIDPRFALGGGYDEDGNMLEKSVDTFYLVGYLVKAVQELSAEIDRMKKGMKAS